MVTVFIYGLDQFVVGRLSRELNENLAKLCEVKEEEIIFVGPNNMVFHNGVEQTSWNAIVNVTIPSELIPLEDSIAKLIMEYISVYTINVTVYFTRFNRDSEYQKINEEYPRYITESNTVSIDEEGSYFDSLDDAEFPDEESEEIYDGDIFKDFHD